MLPCSYMSWVKKNLLQKIITKKKLQGSMKIKDTKAQQEEHTTKWQNRRVTRILVAVISCIFFDFQYLSNIFILLFLFLFNFYFNLLFLFFNLFFFIFCHFCNRCQQQSIMLSPICVTLSSAYAFNWWFPKRYIMFVPFDCRFLVHF